MRLRSWFIVAALSSIGSTLSAEPRLPYVFGDHMVFQRDAAIRVWGWAEPGEAISVALAGRTQSTVAGTDSRWQVELETLPPGGPFVRGQKIIQFKDVHHEWKSLSDELDDGDGGQRAAVAFRSLSIAKSTTQPGGNCEFEN